jgi:hypothetical protein
VSTICEESQPLLELWEPQAGGHGEIESDTNAGAETSPMSKTGLKVFDGDLMAEILAAWKNVR